MLDVNKIKKDFPILNRKINGNRLVYLDNSATTQKPIQVINAIKEYYENYNANVHRGIYKLSEEATYKYEEAHKKVADFINADHNEIIFTKNTTESLNLLAYSLTSNLKEGDEIILTQMEHHSNLVPWQQIAKQKNLKLKFIEIDNEGKLKLDQLNDLITKKTKIVSVTAMSNVLGTINNIEKIGKIVHDNDALFIVDGAQSVPHSITDVKKIDCDFLCFSSHKMLGPTGIGVLFGKKNLLESMKPFLYGGDMIKEVKFSDTEFNEIPWKFEAGTPNACDGVALGTAVDYLNEIGMQEIMKHEKELSKYALEKLSQIKSIKIYGPKSLEDRNTVISFSLNNIHSHDISAMLDQYGIAIRGGHMCAMPLMSLLGVNGLSRASFYIYNDKEDVDILVESLKKVKGMFN